MTTQNSEIDAKKLAAINQAVGQSEKGFSASYRASNAVRKVDPLFDEANQILRQFKGDDWLGLSSKLRGKISLMAAKQLPMEIQLVSLQMIDRRLLPLNAFSGPGQEKAFYGELGFYLQQLVEQKGIDLDVMTKAVLRLDGHANAGLIVRAKAHILEVAAKDSVMATEKLKDLENSSDRLNFDLVSKRHYEQVLKEAEYAIATLGQ